MASTLMSSYPAKVIAAASKYLGTGYTWGGGNQNGPSAGGFDCSGLVMYAVYQATGGQVLLPHQSQQIDDSPLLDTVYVYNNNGSTPDWSKIPIGAILCFYDAPGIAQSYGDYNDTPVSHVGIYVGGGRMIDAPHPGGVVSIDKIEGNWFTRFDARYLTGQPGTYGTVSNSSDNTSPQGSSVLNPQAFNAYFDPSFQGSTTAPTTASLAPKSASSTWRGNSNGIQQT